MPKYIPGGLTRQHVELALTDLDSGVSTRFGQAAGYELIYSGKRYAPKAVIGLAFKHLTGTVLEHEEFSGGEGPGRANYVLRDLGFEVVAKAGGASAGFITSRPELPVDAGEMAESFWFNMWERGLWPYNEVREGHTLYWYDSKKKAIVWTSRVAQLDQFEYMNKKQVRQRLKAFFGDDVTDDPYYARAKDTPGHCLAYVVESLVRLNVPKPAKVRFPMNGWLRCSDEDAAGWLAGLTHARIVARPFADELSRATTEVVESGFFATESLTDERERKLRAIAQRQGQPAFRNKLLTTFGGRCVVTGCDAVDALEAAHIAAYSGPQSNHVTNGLLLRADIHTLFDLNLIGIDPESLCVAVSEAVASTTYADLAGCHIRLPKSSEHHPNNEALVRRWNSFCGTD